jgi:hypothetical protein
MTTAELELIRRDWNRNGEVICYHRTVVQLCNELGHLLEVYGCLQCGRTVLRLESASP